MALLGFRLPRLEDRRAERVGANKKNTHEVSPQFSGISQMATPPFTPTILLRAGLLVQWRFIASYSATA